LGRHSEINQGVETEVRGGAGPHPAIWRLFRYPAAQMGAIVEFLLANPWVRALIPLALIAVAGVAGNSLVTEVTKGNTVEWDLMPHKVSFYLLLAATLLSAIYQIAIERRDKELARGFTAKQYEARIRNRVAEVVAKRSQKLIREGNVAQLEVETETFKRLYGERP
jgi:hypothetical protein